MKKKTQVRQFGDYTIKLIDNQISVSRGKDNQLVRVTDIKNISYIDEEFEEYVQKFQRAYETKFNPQKQ